MVCVELVTRRRFVGGISSFFGFTLFLLMPVKENFFESLVFFFFKSVDSEEGASKSSPPLDRTVSIDGAITFFFDDFDPRNDRKAELNLERALILGGSSTVSSSTLSISSSSSSSDLQKLSDKAFRSSGCSDCLNSTSLPAVFKSVSNDFGEPTFCIIFPPESGLGWVVEEFSFDGAAG